MVLAFLSALLFVFLGVRFFMVLQADGWVLKASLFGYWDDGLRRIREETADKLVALYRSEPLASRQLLIISWVEVPVSAALAGVVGGWLLLPWMIFAALMFVPALLHSTAEYAAWRINLVRYPLFGMLQFVVLLCAVAGAVGYAINGFA